MWLMTKHGFYSIVEKQPGEYHIRARERKDLENLTTGDGPLQGAKIIETPDADYHFRVIVRFGKLAEIMIFLARGVNYPNFKNEVHSRLDQANKPYTQIWHVLANALGAYNRTPKGR